jgi:hypothetical protein
MGWENITLNGEGASQPTVKPKTSKGIATKPTKQSDQLNSMRRKVEQGFNRVAETNAKATIEAAKEASD